MNIKCLKRILVAVRPIGNDPLFDALRTEFDLRFCASILEAKSVINNGIDLIICGMNFDESSMFDLLKLVKSHPNTREIPFLSIKVFEGVLPTGTFDGVKHAVKLLGANAFIDFSAITKEKGKAYANEYLRKVVHDLVHGPSFHAITEQKINLSCLPDCAESATIHGTEG